MQGQITDSPLYILFCRSPFSVKSDRPVGPPNFRTIAGEDEEVPKKGTSKKKNRKKNVTHVQGPPFFPRFQGNALMLIGVYLLRLTFSAT